MGYDFSSLKEDAGNVTGVINEDKERYIMRKAEKTTNKNDISKIPDGDYKFPDQMINDFDVFISGIAHYSKGIKVDFKKNEPQVKFCRPKKENCQEIGKTYLEFYKTYTKMSKSRRIQYVSRVLNFMRMVGMLNVTEKPCRCK